MGKIKDGILNALKKGKRKEMGRQVKGIAEFVDTYFFIEGLQDSDYKKILKKIDECADDLKHKKHLGKYLNEKNIREIALTSPEFSSEFLEDDYEDYL